MGEDITKLTRFGFVPRWKTVRARFWKNEAFFNAAEYSGENLIRMAKGKAPQRINEAAGALESMELHHDPPQREGGLFDFEKMWPEDHKAADPYRH